MGGEQRRGRLAVGPRDGEDRAPRGAKPQLELGDELDAAVGGARHDLGAWWDARADDRVSRVAELVATEHDLDAVAQLVAQ